MLAWLAPIIVFGLVVFVHELGHFLAAKAVGVYAPRFSIGFGPALFRRRWGETEYVIAALPLGGYVRMASREDETMAFLEGGGEHAPDEPNTVGASGGPKIAEEHIRDGMRPDEYDPDALVPFGPKPVPEHRWFESKGLLARLFILVAGVTMNFILTLVVSVGSIAYYGSGYVAPVVDSVVAGMPAAGAGLMAGDTIVAVNGAPVERWTEVVDRVTPAAGDTLTFAIQRAGQRVELPIVPTSTPAQGLEATSADSVGRIGAAVDVTAVVRTPVSLGDAIPQGWNATIGLGTLVLTTVQGLFQGDVSMTELGGPIAIGQASVQAAQSGVETLLYLIAFLSINIAILNLLPIPILDGGQIIMNIAESVKGSPFSLRTRENIAKVGIAAIALLFAVVMFNDIKRLIQTVLG